MAPHSRCAIVPFRKPGLLILNPDNSQHRPGNGPVSRGHIRMGPNVAFRSKFPSASLQRSSANCGPPSPDRSSVPDRLDRRLWRHRKEQPPQRPDPAGPGHGWKSCHRRCLVPEAPGLGRIRWRAQRIQHGFWLEWMQRRSGTARMRCPRVDLECTAAPAHDKNPLRDFRGDRWPESADCLCEITWRL